ncbi:MAG: hypothetical protein ACYS8Z_00750 [Planctomycetota bacterium]|jgi:hypothetical protein
MIGLSRKTKTCVVRLLSIIVLSSFAEAGETRTLFLSCSPQNDLYKVLELNGVPTQRFQSPDRAVSAAPFGGPVLILAGGYPEETTDIEPSVFELAKLKKLRLYIEFPGSVPGIELASPRKIGVERAVVADDFFGDDLQSMRIMAINAREFVPAKNNEAHIVFAKVAGFDTAVYGLPEKTWPVLFECPDAAILVATTKLSNFVTARFAPRDAAEQMWRRILLWLGLDANDAKLEYTEAVRTNYSRAEPLPTEVETEAVERAMAWYKNSKLLVSEEADLKVREVMSRHLNGTLEAPDTDETVGDGSRGIMQCYLSGIGVTGKQRRSAVRRGDNQCEAAMTFALAGKLTGDEHHMKVAENLLDYYLFDSQARKGPRADPNHGAYGMIAWGIDHPAWMKANYGDDNARQMMGIVATAAITGRQRWNEALALCILANIRTTGRNGFRPGRIDIEPLTRNGWRPYFDSNFVRLSPHYEAYLWAVLLWAYEHTGDQLLYERTAMAIRKTMENYPDRWRWTNGLAQEKARMLLPLAWLVRVKDTPEHRRWLRRIAEDLIALQAECGAIQEQLGKPGMGDYPPPPSNEAYGGNEASLIQKNGDPVCDLLYTTNFAFLGLHEAAEATGEKYYSDAEDKLAEFLCRIQVRSDVHPEFDGAWFRGFDFERWQYWASDADAGWGAWCAITGWTHSWITSVLAMRQMDTSLWELTTQTTFVEEYNKFRSAMLPEN